MPTDKSFSGLKSGKEQTSGEGERLEREMWEDMKSFNLQALESKIAPEFQSIHPDGSRNKTGELELIKNLNLRHFSLSNFKITESGDMLIVTYLVSAPETIDERRLSSKPAPRMSIWKKKDGQWQWIAHANLHPMKNYR